MRYSPDDETLKDNFVEYSDSWSRGEVRDAYKLMGDPFLALIKGKIIALHLECSDGGEPISDPATITEEVLDRVDVRVWAWFQQTWIKHLNDLADMGEALGRKLFASSDTSKAATTDAPAPRKS